MMDTRKTIPTPGRARRHHGPWPMQGRPKTITWTGITCALALLVPGGVFAIKGASVDATRTVIEKWVETRRLISQEKRDWALASETLEERIALVEREIESVRQKAQEAEKSIAEADKKRADLVLENERLKDASASLSSTITTLEFRTQELLRRLPDPIRTHVKPLSQRIPTTPEDSDLSMAERFQNIVGILNEINKFNAEITVVPEVQELPDGTRAEVTAMYVGIGQGYYVSADGRTAGLGVPSDEGWVWQPADDAAAQIAQAIAILQNERVASFVQLPVHIK